MSLSACQEKRTRKIVVLDLKSLSADSLDRPSRIHKKRSANQHPKGEQGSGSPGFVAESAWVNNFHLGPGCSTCRALMNNRGVRGYCRGGQVKAPTPTRTEAASPQTGTHPEDPFRHRSPLSLVHTPKQLKDKLHRSCWPK